MAAAAFSPLASSVEKTNGAKLSRLLIDGGSTVLRKIFDRYHPPANLSADLNANYHTLNNLLRRRVLHKPQWNLLFPPGGATPDSKTFDITLLFLLLTNICGLSPPPSGWHTRPPLSDTSVEANLARIKFFRNKLYGHVTSTGIDTPIFSALWLRISAVLVALGLSQAEVDRLKAEHCGESDCIDVFFEWADSEEDIKSQLKDIRQTQTNTLEGVAKLLDRQEEFHETLKKTKSRVEESHEKLSSAQCEHLEAMRCGEEHFIEVLSEWADSEEGIKSQLKGIRQTVDEVQSTQLEERNILQDNIKRRLEEVHQEQAKTQQTVDEVRQSQIKTQHTVDEVRQSQIKIQHTVDQVHQRQLEDRGTIQDSDMKLQQVFQIDRKTHELLTNVRETQIDDSKAIQEIHHTQHEFRKTLQETKSRVEEIQQTHEKLLGTQDKRSDCLRLDLKQTAVHFKGQREKHRENKILKKLAKIETMENVRYHADRYVEGTRLSVFAKIESWLNDRSSPNRVMVVSGNAGMGKSVISAMMCKKMQEAGRLAGSHFCQYDRVRHSNPRVMLQSLASQLCDSLPDYRKALVEKLSRNLGVKINNMKVKDLFEVLFEEPLASLNDPGLTCLMVIDGLDESEFQGRNELLDVIADYFQTLPLWIRFLVTTRPERNIAENLKNLHPLHLDPNFEENMRDIHLCFDKQVNHLLQSEHQEIILQALVQKSEGVMLYAHYLVDFIKKEESFLTPELLDSILPSGISSVYQSYFKRLENELCKELNVDEGKFLLLLGAVAAAREPLPLGFVSKLLLPGESTSLAQRKVNAAIACVSALLPVQDECIHFFHKSVKDWLIEISNYGQHHFSVDEKEGHDVLSKVCIDELDDVKRKGVDCAEFTDTTKYALRHGVQHLLQVEDSRVYSLQDVVKKFVLDIELVYAKLCVNVTLAFEDIVYVQRQAGIEELQSALNDLLILLRKHIDTLEELPHTIFQTLLNEGGPELSSQTLNLLETNYTEMAYMEYLHKGDLQGRVQTKCHCSSLVTCFDVSPQLDYMVCECKDNTIQLWSLHTGRRLWERDVRVTKYYYFEPDCDDCSPIYEPYRATNNYYYYHGDDDDDLSYPPKSLYRSVVFHPTEDLVLPGILSHAYTFDGNLKPLFLSSRCRFSVCSVSAEKTKMLTDCPNDAESIIMWSLTDGSAMNRFAWNCDILSFAWSRDGRLLSISDLSKSVTLVDVMDGYRTLAQTTISEVCGMIKFTPDCRRLYCLHFSSHSCNLHCVYVNMENEWNFSLDVFPEKVSNHPWELESCSETGYLLGDPFCFPHEKYVLHQTPALAFVLDKQSVLRVSYFGYIIEMLQLDELTKDSARDSVTTVRNVVLSLNGDTLFVIAATDQNPVTLMGWDISSGMFKPGKRVFEVTGGFDAYDLVAVREGVLLQTSYDAFELWNFELSECIRSWTVLGYITQVIPISEERVACDGGRIVIIVDTTKEGIVSSIPIHGRLVACNSKCHVITIDHEEIQMRCGDVVLWKISPEPFDYVGGCKTFSPTEQYCVLSGSACFDVALCVLDLVLGKTLNIVRLFTPDYSILGYLECKFVSDEECVACFIHELRGHFLQLFNVKSGDLLSEIAMESNVYSLAVCPSKRLIAIGFEDSRLNFKVVQVKLPGDKHSRKSKRSSFINKEQSYNTMTSPESPEGFYPITVRFSNKRI